MYICSQINLSIYLSTITGQGKYTSQGVEILVYENLAEEQEQYSW